MMVQKRLNIKTKSNNVVAYLRVSTDKQDLKNQRHEILEYANKHHFTVNRFIELQMSSRRGTKERRIEELLQNLNPGDTAVVAELSRLGRSLGEILDIVNSMVKRQINFISIKENITFNGRQDIQTKVMIAMFGLFAEIERDLISQRTKEALKARKAEGVVLGRPKGVLSKSRLDDRMEEIQKLLDLGIPKVRVAKTFGVTVPTLYKWIKSRKIKIQSERK